MVSSMITRQDHTHTHTQRERERERERDKDNKANLCVWQTAAVVDHFSQRSCWKGEVERKELGTVNSRVEMRARSKSKKLSASLIVKRQRNVFPATKLGATPAHAPSQSVQSFGVSASTIKNRLLCTLSLLLSRMLCT